MHDVFEDTDIIKVDIKNNFGYEIANGVYILSRNTISVEERDVILKIMGTSMNQIPRDTTPREIVEKLYKIRLTFARSLVLRVKIADTIDNTLDLENLSLEGRKRKIEDSINFYIPLGKVIAPEMIKELEENLKRYEEKI